MYKWFYSKKKTAPEMSSGLTSAAASVLTTSLATMPTVEYLVLDANAIIHGFGTNFHTKAKHIVTIPEVIDEIKDEHARELLGRLPYTIELREPSVDACRTGIFTLFC